MAMKGNDCTATDGFTNIKKQNWVHKFEFIIKDIINNVFKLDKSKAC